MFFAAPDTEIRFDRQTWLDSSTNKKSTGDSNATLPAKAYAVAPTTENYVYGSFWVKVMLDRYR